MDRDDTTSSTIVNANRFAKNETVAQVIYF